MWRLAKISIFLTAALFSSEIGVLTTQRLTAPAPFAAVTVIQAGFVITRPGFRMQPDRIYVGDLVGCWGQPTTVVGISHYGSARIHLVWHKKPPTGLPPLARIELHWDDQIVAEVSPLLRLGTQQVYFQPVTSLSIEEHVPPCGLGH